MVLIFFVCSYSACRCNFDELFARFVAHFCCSLGFLLTGNQWDFFLRSLGDPDLTWVGHLNHQAQVGLPPAQVGLLRKERPRDQVRGPKHALNRAYSGPKNTKKMQIYRDLSFFMFNLQSTKLAGEIKVYWRKQYPRKIF